MESAGAGERSWKHVCSSLLPNGKGLCRYFDSALRALKCTYLAEWRQSRFASIFLECALVFSSDVKAMLSRVVKIEQFEGVGPFTECESWSPHTLA